MKGAVEGEFTISELKFSPAFSDHDSEDFKTLAGDIEQEVWFLKLDVFLRRKANT